MTLVGRPGLSGGVIQQPILKFDYSLSFHRHNVPLQGLIRFGPYDKHVRPFNRINTIVIAPQNLISRGEKLISDLNNGLRPYFGLNSIFKHNMTINIINSYGINVSSNLSNYQQANIYSKELKKIVNRLRLEDVDIALTIIPRQTSEAEFITPYYRSKYFFSSLGLPSQVITKELLLDPNRYKWSLLNIAIQIYAKVGGIPWTLETIKSDPDIIIGIGSAYFPPEKEERYRIGSKRRMIAFLIVFQKNGALSIFKGKPIMTFEKFEEEIEQSIIDIIEQFISINGRTPNRITIHSFKRANKNEINAVEKACKKWDPEIPYTFVRINNAETYRLYDERNSSMVPMSGTMTKLSEKTSLLSGSGKAPFTASTMGTPIPLYINIESTNCDENIEQVTKQVFKLTRMDWRTIRGVRQEPITTAYPKLILQLVESIRIGELEEGWNILIMQTALADKTWFI